MIALTYFMTVILAVISNLKQPSKLISAMKQSKKSMVYLLTLKTDCFKAVLRAHKEFKALDRPVKEQEVRTYLTQNKGKAEVKGRYGRWIILQSILKGESIFEHIESEVL
mgnify:CR=1 FL=1